MFLLRRFRTTGDAALADFLGVALAAAVANCRSDQSPPFRARWLMALADAAGLSDDERLADAARSLLDDVACAASAATIVPDALTAVDACLTAAVALQPSIDFAAAVRRAVDDLERVVGAAYRPGRGIAHDIADGARGDLADHVCAASALLTAYAVTGRLPYSMLAEELTQSTRGELDAAADLWGSCDAVRVLCRLAVLHRDAEYRKSAVVDERADYRADAERVLARWADRVLTSSASEAASYGLALADWYDSDTPGS
jgi:hypothetical protein